MFDVLTELNANEKDVTVRMLESLTLCHAALFNDLKCIISATTMQELDVLNSKLNKTMRPGGDSVFINHIDYVLSNVRIVVDFHPPFFALSFFVCAYLPIATALFRWARKWSMCPSLPLYYRCVNGNNRIRIKIYLFQITKHWKNFIFNCFNA